MRIEIRSKKATEEYKDAFKAEVENINPKIKEMIRKKGVSLILVDFIYELVDEKRKQKMKEAYKYDRKEELTRGLTSDEVHCIAIAYDTVPIDFIGALLYHEIGHFLDLYEVYGQVNSLYDMTFSADKKFINAYTKDFEDHYEIIKNDNNYRLKHFIQDSIPGRINQNAVSETFAELYRFANNKKNDTETVELYFPTALDVSQELLKERYGL